VIRIEIVYAQPQRYVARSLSMAQGAVIADALGLIAADPEFSGIDLVGSGIGAGHLRQSGAARSAAQGWRSDRNLSAARRRTQARAPKPR